KEMLFRYRARNFPETLGAEESERWRHFCRQRIESPETRDNFFNDLEKATIHADSSQLKTLAQLQHYVSTLFEQLKS
ncbi:MAG TPA: exodeoxyribonuclease I, partial [Gammaproteobacteria bacterium]|nr:exodeoxyribonuclease I [Gammaproteobacteria bacterium]